MLNLLYTCGQCKDLIFDSCTSVVIDSTLTPGTVYYWFLEDGRGKIFKGNSTPDGYYRLWINLNQVPKGLFDKATGPLKLTFALDAKGEQPVQVPMGYDTYDCLTLNFA